MLAGDSSASGLACRIDVEPGAIVLVSWLLAVSSLGKGTNARNTPG